MMYGISHAFCILWKIKEKRNIVPDSVPQPPNFLQVLLCPLSNTKLHPYKS